MITSGSLETNIIDPNWEVKTHCTKADLQEEKSLTTQKSCLGSRPKFIVFASTTNILHTRIFPAIDSNLCAIFEENCKNESRIHLSS